jgi:hypothetical protein
MRIDPPLVCRRNSSTVITVNYPVIVIARQMVFHVCGEVYLPRDIRGGVAKSYFSPRKITLRYA